MIFWLVTGVPIGAYGIAIWTSRHRKTVKQCFIAITAWLIANIAVIAALGGLTSF